MPTSIAAILVLFTLCSFSSTCQAEEARTVVILDATAQMGANLGQKRKLDWAKTGISGAVSRMEPGSSFTLWAFGTSPEKKCEDISELVPLQAAGGSLRTLDKALGALQPKAARAPAMDTLQSALKSARPADGKPVVAVLVAGTGDDCIGDICGAAGQLHGLYSNAKLTVLGMSMSEQAAANFTCAAKAMGGAFIGVKSGADLERHLRETFGAAQTAGQPKAAAVTSANAAGGETAANPPEAPAAAPATPPADQPAEKEVEVAPPPQPEPNVVLSASLVSGMPPLEAGVTWEIYKIQITPTGQVRTAEAPLWVGGGGQAKAKLPEGRYSVKVAYGLATGSGEFALGTEKVEKTIALAAGTIVAEAQQAAPNGPPVGDAFFIVSKPKTPTREELGRSSGAPALFHLNEGDYVLSAFAGAATLDASIKVVAGKVSVVRMPLSVGTLEIKTFAKEGAPELVAAWHRLSPAASDSKNGALPMLRISGPSNKLQLPAGSYRLESVYGNARVESVVTVKAGQLTSQNVILNAGEAQLSLPSGKSDKVCAVYEAGADRKGGPVGRAAGSDIRFILKAGRYEVECKGKGENSPAKQTEISVVAGQVQSAKIQE